jgi:hypothetical protein
VLRALGALVLKLLLQLCLGAGDLGHIGPSFLHEELVQDRARLEQLSLLGHVRLCLLLGAVQGVALLLHQLEAIHLPPALLIELLQRLGLGVDVLHVLLGADDILQVLQQTLVVGVHRRGIGAGHGRRRRAAG